MFSPCYCTRQWCFIWDDSRLQSRLDASECEPGPALAQRNCGRRDRVRGALVAVEVALALALVVVGGQLLASFAALLRTDPGFDAKRVTAFIVLPDRCAIQTPEKWEAFYRRVLDSVRVLPGIDSAGTDDALPFSGENTGGLVGKSAGGAPQSGQIPAEIDVVSAGYLQTMGIRLLQGRWLNEEDMNDSSDAAIVSDLVAKRLWPGESAIGKPVCVFCSPENPNNWKRVVGVVSSSRHASMDGPQQQATCLSFRRCFAQSRISGGAKRPA